MPVSSVSMESRRRSFKSDLGCSNCVWPKVEQKFCVVYYYPFESRLVVLEHPNVLGKGSTHADVQGEGYRTVPVVTGGRTLVARAA